MIPVQDIPIPIPGIPDLPFPDIGGIPGDLASGIVDALSQALAHAIAGIADSLFTAMIGELLATTSVTLDGWFTGPWSAMLAVSGLLAVPILLCGVLSEVIAGRPGIALRRGLALPLLIGPLLLAARAVLGLLLAVVNGACAELVNLGIGGPSGYREALFNMHSMFGLGTASLASPLLAGPALVLTTLAVAFLAFVIWIELALRAALIYLLAAFIPLALAGLFWSATGRWTRRLLETLLAIVLSQLVITVVMVLAAASLKAPASGLSAGVDQVAVGLALLFLGSLGLPMTMRLIPAVAEASIAAGTGALVAGRARRTASSATGRLSGLGTQLGVRSDLLTAPTRPAHTAPHHPSPMSSTTATLPAPPDARPSATPPRPGTQSS